MIDGKFFAHISVVPIRQIQIKGPFFMIETLPYTWLSTNLQFVQYLNLQCCFTDRLIADMCNLKYLTKLDISNTQNKNNRDVNVSFPHSLKYIDAKSAIIEFSNGTIYLHLKLENLNVPKIQLHDHRNQGILFCKNIISDLQYVNIRSAVSNFGFLAVNCTFPYMKTLIVANIKLNRFFQKPASHRLLHSMYNLESLDLTNTSLSEDHLKRNTLLRQIKMKYLKLGNNNIKEFRIKINQMTQLEWLDLSRNRLACLSPLTMYELDYIQKNSNVTIDITDNRLMCSCSCLSFLEWLTKTTVNVANVQSIHCDWDEVSIPLFQNNAVSVILLDLNAKCYPIFWLTVPCWLVCILLVIISVGSIAYRLRYILAYYWHKLQLRARQELRMQSDFKYDAFICYDHNDIHFIKEKIIPHIETQGGDFTLCIHHRDFLPGAAIVDNIIEALHNSRYAILVVSRNSVKSEWWKCELNMAHQMSLERQYNMIICVFLEDIPADELPPTIGHLLRVFTCLRWPVSEDARDLFWIKLKRALKQ